MVNQAVPANTYSSTECTLEAIRPGHIDVEELAINRFCIIRQFLSSDAVSLLLNGRIKWEHRLSTRRVATKVWNGCYNLTRADIKYFGKVPLPDGRVDIHLPPALARKIVPIDEEELLRNFPDGFRIASYQLLINPHNPKVQDWHQDHGGLKDDEYYTLLIPLVDEEGMGKTEVRVPYSKSFKERAQVITPDVSVGDGLLFSGSLWHRGTPNLSEFTRYCIYLVISSAPEKKLFESWN